MTLNGRYNTTDNSTYPGTRIVFLGDSTLTPLFQSFSNISQSIEDLTISLNNVKSSRKSFVLEFFPIDQFNVDDINNASLVIIGAGIEWIDPETTKREEKRNGTRDRITMVQRKKMTYNYMTRYVKKMEGIKKRLERISIERDVFWYLPQDDPTNTITRKNLEVFNDIARNTVVQMVVGKTLSNQNLMCSYRSRHGVQVAPCGDI